MFSSKHTNIASAARWQIIGGGAPIIKNSRRRRPQIDIGGAAAQGSNQGTGFKETDLANLQLRLLY